MDWLVLWAIVLSVASAVLPAGTWLLRRDLILDAGVVGTWIALQVVTTLCLAAHLVAPPLPASGWLLVDAVWTLFLLLGMAYHRKLSSVPTPADMSLVRAAAARRRDRARQHVAQAHEDAHAYLQEVQ